MKFDEEQYEAVKSDEIAKEMFGGATFGQILPNFEPPPFPWDGEQIKPPPQLIPKEVKDTKADLSPVKPRWEYLDFLALQSAAEVMALNETKHKQVNNGAEYSDGWKKISKTKHFGSLMRHLSSYWIWVVSNGKVGEFHDPETGLPHLSHALCRVMFLLGIELG